MNGNIGVSGALTALITPIHEDGSVDFIGLKRNVEFQISQGIAGLVPMGTTGESPTLSYREHCRVIRVVEENAGGIFVLAGCGSNSTREALDYVAYAEKAKCPAVLLVDPYYNGPSSLEIAENYYRIVAKAFPDITIVPYIIPGRTGCELAVEDLVRLAHELPNLRAVKEATGSRDRMCQTRMLAPEGFSIFSGDDDITYGIMAEPDIIADGVISVISNICPVAVSSMCNALLARDLDEAQKLDKALRPLFSLVTVKADRVVTLGNLSSSLRGVVKDKFRNPLPIKTIMQALGMPAGPCRSPLGKMTKAGIIQVRCALKTVMENNPELLTPIENFYGVRISERLADDATWTALTYQP